MVMQYPELRYLRVPGNTLHRILFTPLSAPYKPDLDVLTNPGSPLLYKIQHQYANLPQNTLRWRVLTAMSAKAVPKATVRERLRRRHREAFLAALKMRGFDKYGGVLNTESKSPNVKPLFGTLEAQVYGGLGEHLKFPVLVKQAVLAIDAVRKTCHDHLSSPSGDSNHYWTKRKPRGRQPLSSVPGMTIKLGKRS